MARCLASAAALFLLPLLAACSTDSSANEAMPPAPTATLSPAEGTASPLAAATPARPTTVIDWVPFIRFGGISYLAQSWIGRGNPAPDAAALGPVHDHVDFEVSANVSDPNYRIKDGDAAFLAAGTPLYAVNGYSPEFLLATLIDGRVELYEADTVPGAATGRDLLDIKNKVVSVGINHASDGIRSLAVIADSSTVDSLVDAVLAAPVKAQDGSSPGHDQVFLAFNLADGLVIRRSYWLDTGQLSRGIVLPQSARDLIAAALAGS